MHFLAKIITFTVAVMAFRQMAANVLWLCVCYFGLQTLQALDKIYRQNNSTKPLLYAGGGWLNENQNATRI